MRRRLFFMLLVLLVVTICVAQTRPVIAEKSVTTSPQNKQQELDLRPFDWFLSDTYNIRKDWADSNDNHFTKLIDADEVVLVLARLTIEEETPTTVHRSVDDSKLEATFFLKQHREPIKRICRMLDKWIADGKVAGFIPNQWDKLPMTFLKTEDNRVIFAIQGLTLPTVYDLQSLSLNQRAAAAINSVIVPLLSRYDPSLQQPGIDYFCVSIVYGCKNDMEDSKPEGEALVVLTPASAIKEFQANKLTASEVLAKSELYISNKDTEKEVQKIRVIL